MRDWHKLLKAEEYPETKQKIALRTVRWPDYLCWTSNLQDFIKHLEKDPLSFSHLELYVFPNFDSYIEGYSPNRISL